MTERVQQFLDTTSGRVYPAVTVRAVMYDAAYLPERSAEDEVPDTPTLFAAVVNPSWAVTNWPVAWL